MRRARKVWNRVNRRGTTRSSLSDLWYKLGYYLYKILILLIFGGEGGIRTHGSRKRSPDFESGPFGQLRHLSDAERTQEHIT